MLNENFVYLGLFINLLGAASYVKDTLQGKVQPNKLSWGLWALGVIIAFFAELSEGVGIQAWATFMVGFTPLLIFVASFVNKKSYWKLTKFDLLCGILSLFGLALWQITKLGNLAILFSIFADVMAGAPTLIKSYKYPETENWVEFMSSFVSMTLALLTLKVFTFAHVAFPLYIIIFDLTAVLFIKFKIGKYFSAKS